MDVRSIFSLEVFGQGMDQLTALLLAFVLSSIIGLEREISLKSAGLRTHAIVGLGAALIMLVSKYGFSDIIQQNNVGLDPSRVAAQIVSGIGFIGGGLIFVRKDIVHGLTTAATIWLTAGIGMACGGGMPMLAMAATFGHFVVIFGYTRIMRRVLGASSRFSIRYHTGRDAAAKILAVCAEHGFTVRSFSMKSENSDSGMADMVVRVQGHKSLAPLVERLASLSAVETVNADTSKEDE